MTGPRKKQAAQAKKVPKDASPINGVVPPKEYRWKPGQSGNPRGVPKGTVFLTDYLRKLLKMNDYQAAKVLCHIILEKAMEGDFKFVKEVWDRMDGPVRQEVENTIMTHYKVHKLEDVEDAV